MRKPGNMASSCEVWKPVPDWPYEASSLGRVRRLLPGRGTRIGHILATKPHKYGYPMVDLSRENRVTRFQVGRLVCLAFHGRPLMPKLKACHRNGVPTDNVPANVYWGTQQQNMADARRHGTTARGERHGIAKLTESSVREMRTLRGAGMTFKALSEKFGVSQSNACAACNGRQWGHVS
jgi:hypothetical protein